MSTTKDVTKGRVFHLQYIDNAIGRQHVVRAAYRLYMLVP